MLRQFLDSNWIVGIIFLIFSYLIWDKQYIFLVGYTKNSKIYKKIKDKKKLAKSLAKIFLVMGLLNIFLGIINVVFIDGDFAFLLSYFLLVLSFLISYIYRKVDEGKY